MQGYENARRAGKTNPDKIEIIGKDDPRSFEYRDPNRVLNRSERRRYLKAVNGLGRGRVAAPYGRMGKRRANA